MLASSSRHPGALPSPQTSLLGRDREIESLRSLLSDPHVRLLTLTGPGGVGKTRLAIAAAASLDGDFPDGIYAVSLAQIVDPDLVAPTIVAALDVEEVTAQPALETLVAYLRDRSTLLVLDNFEQVLDAAAIVSELVRECANLTILVTSRVPLHLISEREFAVAPLDLPDATLPLDSDHAMDHAAVAMFVERARSARPDFRLTAANVAVVAEICRRLDGLPLAIELAAARTKLMTPSDILPRLRQRLAILTGGFRDVPARQRTMRDAIAWSYDLLDAADQRLFRQLAIFAGGWSLEAAEAVCDSDLDILDGLSRLLDSNLIRRVERPNAAARFTMLETIREFGLEQLDISGNRNEISGRHEAYVLWLAEDVGGDLMGPDQANSLRILDSETDNVRAVLAGLLARGDGDRALQLAVILEEYWYTRLRLDEMNAWLTRALEACTNAPPSLRAKAHNLLGNATREYGDYETAEREHRRAMMLYREAGDRAGLISVTGQLAWMALYRGHYERSIALYEKALALARTLNDKALLANALAGMAVGLSVQGEYDIAINLCEESLALWRDLGASSAISKALFYLGYFRLWRGDLDLAERLGQEAVRIAREIDHPQVAGTSGLLGYVALERGDLDRSEALFHEAMSYPLTQLHSMLLAECLEGMAGVCGRRGIAVRGATLLGSAEAVRERINSPIPPPRRTSYDRTLGAIRDHLDTSVLDHAWTRGRLMSSQAARNYALGHEDALATAEHAVSANAIQTNRPPAPAGLTSRELEVLRLIVDGRTNQEVADALFISARTVSTHLTSIFTKLDVTTRTAAASWAMRHGIATEASGSN